MMNNLLYTLSTLTAYHFFLDKFLEVELPDQRLCHIEDLQHIYIGTQLLTRPVSSSLELIFDLSFPFCP